MASERRTAPRAEASPVPAPAASCCARPCTTIPCCEWRACFRPRLVLGLVVQWLAHALLPNIANV
eukprot:350306-Chlamydomonas_euryale.AAC.5